MEQIFVNTDLLSKVLSKPLQALNDSIQLQKRDTELLSTEYTNKSLLSGMGTLGLHGISIFISFVFLLELKKYEYICVWVCVYT